MIKDLHTLLLPVLFILSEGRRTLLGDLVEIGITETPRRFDIVNDRR
jgi:hypothetical protein